MSHLLRSRAAHPPDDPLTARLVEVIEYEMANLEDDLAEAEDRREETERQLEEAKAKIERLTGDDAPDDLRRELEEANARIARLEEVLRFEAIPEALWV